MITLNTERELVKVDSWADIETMPGFKRNVDLKHHTLKEIIGNYVFKVHIPCGLSNCHTPHGKGFIVTTKQGALTNIGGTCGKNHFGVEFLHLKKALETEIKIKIKTYREKISNFLMQINKFKEELKVMRQGERGADQIYKSSRRLLNRKFGCSEVVVTALSKMVRARNGDIIMIFP